MNNHSPSGKFCFPFMGRPQTVLLFLAILPLIPATAKANSALTWAEVFGGSLALLFIFVLTFEALYLRLVEHLTWGKSILASLFANLLSTILGNFVFRLLGLLLPDPIIPSLLVIPVGYLFSVFLEYHALKFLPFTKHCQKLLKTAFLMNIASYLLLTLVLLSPLLEVAVPSHYPISDEMWEYFKNTQVNSPTRAEVSTESLSNGNIDIKPCFAFSDKSGKNYLHFVLSKIRKRFPTPSARD